MKRNILLLPLLAMILGLSSCSKNIEACFAETITGATVEFNATCSEGATSYAWDFGDGSTSTVAQPIHAYTSGGNFTVTLVASNKKGKSNTFTKVIAIDACQFTCQNGTCQNGNCVCATGYEGSNCTTPWNAKFSGTFSMNESCTNSGQAGPYGVALAAITNSPTEFNMTGLWESPASTIIATIGGSGQTFTAARQSLSGSSFDIEVTSGTISANGSTINISYTMYQSGNSFVIDQCSGTLTK